MIHLSESEVQALLDMDEVIAAVERAFLDLAAERATNLPRRRVRAGAAMLHLMGAASQTDNLLVYKAYSTSRSGAWFHVAAYRGDTGLPLAWLDADWLGRYRTGAASAVATKYTARQSARTLGVIGAGKQALTQILAISRVRQLDAIYVYSRTPARRQALADLVAQEHRLPVQAVDSARAAVGNADIVVTVTNSATPVFEASWIQPGCHINAVGSNALQRCEVDPEIFKRTARVAIDSVEQGKIEAGDIVSAIANGVLAWEDLVPLQDIVSGKVPGRQAEDEITFFESLGIGIEDLAATAVLLKKVKESLP